MDIDTQRIQKLVEKLRNPNKDVRFEACEWLRALPVITPEAILALQEAINDPDEEVRHSAQTALAAHLPSIDSSRQEESSIKKVEVKKKHSELGIASVIITILEMVFWVFIVGVDLNYFPDLNADRFSDSGLPLVVVFGAPLVALVLGIGGLIQKDRNKIFALIGIGVSCLVLGFLGFILYIISIYR